MILAGLLGLCGFRRALQGSVLQGLHGSRAVRSVAVWFRLQGFASFSCQAFNIRFNVVLWIGIFAECVCMYVTIMCVCHMQPLFQVTWLQILYAVADYDAP